MPLANHQRTETFFIALQDTTSGTLTLGGQNTLGTNTFSGNITLGSTTNTGKSLTISSVSGGQVDFTGNILKNGTDLTAGATISSGGTVRFAGANTYGGNTTISGTLIAAGTNSSAGTTSVTGTLKLAANDPLASGLVTIGAATVQAFDATVRSLSNQLSIGGGNITLGASSTGALTFSGTTALTATKVWTVTSDSTFSNAISGSTFGITKAGGGTLTFSGANANTYDGLTTVNVGELDLNKTGVVAVGGNLPIGDGTSTDIVKLLQSNQIVSTSAVILNGNAAATLDLNNNSQTIGSLADNSGFMGNGLSFVKLGTGTLTVGDATSTGFSGSIQGTNGNLIKQGQER